MPTGIAPDDFATALADEFDELSRGANGNVRVARPGPWVERRTLEVWVYSSTALPSETWLGPARDGIDRPGVAVMVRSAQNEEHDARLLIERIVDWARDRTTIPGYLLCTVQGGSFFELGQSDEGSFDFTANFVLLRQRKPRPVYWGSAAAPGAYDVAFLESLARSADAGYRFRTLLVEVPAGQRCFYAFPEDMGAPVFRVGSGDGGFAQVASGVAVTHALGADAYQVWASDEGLGPVTVKVR